MTLIVKIMSAENAADEDSRKAHRLITGIVEVEFERSADGTPNLTFYRQDEDPFSLELHGNVYVMNENGRTISSYGCAPLDPPKFEHTIYVDGRPVTNIHVGGPISVSLLRELLETPKPRELIRVNEAGFDEIPMASDAAVFVKNGDRFLTRAA